MGTTLRALSYRYAPALALVAALGLLVVLLPSNEKEAGRISAGGPVAAPAAGQAAPAGAPRPASGPGGAAAPGAATGATGSGTPSGAPASGGVTVAGPSGQTVSPDGAVTVPGAPATALPEGSPFAPAAEAPPGAPRPKIDPAPGPPWCEGLVQFGFPCQSEPWTGDNGGATAQGVTADKIKIARYWPQEDPATAAALSAAGVSETRPEIQRIEDVLVWYFNLHRDTYGRVIEHVIVDASGKGGDETSQRADAVKMDEELGVFACVECPRFAAEELAARGIPSFVTFESTEEFFERTRGYTFASLPSLEEHYMYIAEFWGKRLNGLKARFAGEPLLQGQVRKFGLLWIDGQQGNVDSGAVRARKFFDAELAKYGMRLTVDVGYNYDLSRAPEQATNAMVKMKQNGVTTVTLVGDPLYPIFMTQAATQQGYFPEWFISGTTLTDTTFFGRTYDQAQWSHAFGRSPLWVFWENVETSGGYKEYHHVCKSRWQAPDCEPGDEGVGINTYRAKFSTFGLAVYMAGPNLTTQTLAQGLYSIPPLFGAPSYPLLYWTPERPFAVKDNTEVFWDATQRGKDEVGKDGQGILLKANGGKRYRLGEYPTTEPENDKSKSIYTSDTPIGFEAIPDHRRDGHQHPKEQNCFSCTF